MGAQTSAYMKERGISPETIEQHNIELKTRVLPRDYRLRLGFDQWHNGPLHEVITESIWFPCMDEHTTIHSWIVRPFPVLPSTNGSGEVKFITPKGGNGVYPFIPWATWKVKDKSNQPLLITEGPCKVLAALQAGAFPIGFCGVWQTATNKDGSTALHPALLEHFIFTGRTVYVAFDQALIRTAVLLHKAGAEVKVMTWHQADGKGLDDYLVKTSNGSQSAVQALESLRKKSGTLSDVIRKCDLDFIELEMTRAHLTRSTLSRGSAKLKGSG